MSKYKLHIDREQLWKGCVLKSIAHAINVAHCPDFSHESSWDGFNYSMQDSQGGQGTITFHPNYTIVCLQDVNSERIVRELMSGLMRKIILKGHLRK
ncbi:hypothetical protein IKG_04872 [Bacillus cereus VD200]|nr:hypothetical protein IKG_04872 [Bacillus cereus VD200]